MINGHVFVDNFSTSLGDLSAENQGDMRAVYDCILANGRFSTFEIEGPLCETVTRLFKLELFTIDRSVDYPWTAVTASLKGQAWRDGGTICEVCRGEEFAPVRIAPRIAVLKRCAACNGSGIVPGSTQEAR